MARYGVLFGAPPLHEAPLHTLPASTKPGETRLYLTGLATNAAEGDSLYIQACNGKREVVKKQCQSTGIYGIYTR